MSSYSQGATAIIQRVANHISARLKDIDEKTSQEIGALGMANDLLDELIKMTEELKPCKYCQAVPCQCEAIDAQRDYGRAETWYGNDY